MNIDKKALIAYLKECIAEEEEQYNLLPSEYSKGKIRGYKDVLGDIKKDSAYPSLGPN